MAQDAQVAWKTSAHPPQVKSKGSEPSGLGLHHLAACGAAFGSLEYCQTLTDLTSYIPLRIGRAPRLRESRGNGRGCLQLPDHPILARGTVSWRAEHLTLQLLREADYALFFESILIQPSS